eukprot:6183374-Pleurochrysis_carterae.AAC.4
MHCSQLPPQLGEPVKLTLGEYTNLKLTTPEDMIVAEQCCLSFGLVVHRYWHLGIRRKLLQDAAATRTRQAEFNPHSMRYQVYARPRTGTGTSFDVGAHQKLNGQRCAYGGYRTSMMHRRCSGTEDVVDISSQLTQASLLHAWFETSYNTE